MKLEIEDRIAIVLEELGLYNPHNCPANRAMKRAKKRIAKILRGQKRREEREHEDPGPTPAVCRGRS